MPSIKYYATTIPGLEDIVWKDIQANLNNAELVEESHGRLLFAYSGDPMELLHLRSVENIFISIGSILGITRSRNSLGEIFRRVGNFELDDALRIHKQLHGGKGKKGLTFRVVSNMVGRHNFRRVDAQKAVESSLVNKYNWKMNLDTPVLEFKMDLEEDSVIFGLRLTDERIHRWKYKRSHVPGSLKPTVAYCMSLLSDPKKTDLFIDPMCGAGTIAVERAYANSYHKIIAGDIDDGVIASIKDNIKSINKPIDLIQWDVSTIPLRDHSVDKIVCNLPFGKQTGSHAENKLLYIAFFKEMRRILKSGGKAVLLSTEREIMSELTLKNPSLTSRKSLRIDLQGLKANIYVLVFK